MQVPRWVLRLLMLTASLAREGGLDWKQRYLRGTGRAGS